MHRQFSDDTRAQARLLHKLWRPYLRTRLRAGQRFHALAEHGHFVLRQGAAPLVTTASQAPIPLAI